MKGQPVEFTGVEAYAGEAHGAGEGALVHGVSFRCAWGTRCSRAGGCLL